MVILGLDPGIATVGFGVVNSERDRQTVLRYGTITTPAGLPLSTRLLQIATDLEELVSGFRPDEIAVEELFFNTNVKTGIAVAHGRGVLLMTSEKCGIPVFEYTPLQVKQAVVGYGRAEKQQVMEMTRRLLQLPQIPRPDDAADALAVALCHARSATSLLRRETRLPSDRT
ncbi:crossover junction endodeoxyribonuclease RuvC [Papillibacter cinnamivorans]|uniref:Crossover junction endodeoxyribonuclease RuvC n=1 Tax=Papillibacter cinnamivorans DSM 12816 TaxID=1122930 RepID=A0A1W2CGQ4_9FIRM|nr:crossover junction endodeoxyribonuclease RuvC [Papillibacter cinnamivorans]SMC84393.1 Holliday junction endonuclease RuvC [Papillibacter cinnamivorans DSM 12816]